MPSFADDLFLGTATGPHTGNQGAADPSVPSSGVGPLGRIYVYDIVPNALVSNGICVSQSVSAAASAVLNGSLVSGGVATMDVPRALQMAATAGNTSNVTVTGTDFYGRAQTETRALNGATPVLLTKAFKTVTGVVSAGAISTFTLGTRDAFGMPYRVFNAGYLVHVGWNNTLARDAGTFTAADTTSPATATTNDVRGTYLVSSAADASKRLVIAMALPAIASGPAATTVGAIGVTPA